MRGDGLQKIGPPEIKLKRPPANKYYEAVGLINVLLCEIMKKTPLFLLVSVLVGCASTSQNQHLYEMRSGLGWKPKVQESELSNYIEWNEAIDMIMSRKAKSIFQAHSLLVEIVSKDGKTYQTIEPDIDTVWMILKECGISCADIETSGE